MNTLKDRNTDHIIAALMKVSTAYGTAGLEGEAAGRIKELLSPFGQPDVTPLGSLIYKLRPAREGLPHLMLEAHMDEIGLVVTSVHKDGFLKVSGCGGINRHLLAAAPVRVQAGTGTVPGVICSVPPHLSGDGDKKFPKVEEVFIDTGHPFDELEKLVRPGDRVLFASSVREMPGGRVCGKALDNRAGCISLYKALQCLGDDPLDCGLTVVFSTMEEVGGQGAMTAAYQVAPTHALVVDVSFAYTPGCVKEKCGLFKKGPMIGFSPILSHDLSHRLLDLAKSHSIPCQTEVMGGKTGTNADGIATSRAGVVTGLLSIPLKYMHSPVEMAAEKDITATGELVAAYARSLGREAV